MKPALPPDYRPSDAEPFMNEVMHEYFRQKLLSWKAGLLRDVKLTLKNLQEENWKEVDAVDRASTDAERSIELRTRDRARKLISKIDKALDRIDDNSFGYCEYTGDPIEIKRLEARPVATLGLEAQERHERLEKTKRDGA